MAGGLAAPESSVEIGRAKDHNRGAAPAPFDLSGPLTL
jgi:hypothetical protein